MKIFTQKKVKRTFVICVTVVVFFLFVILLLIFSKTTSNQEKNITEYLETKYEQTFIINERIETPNDNVVLYAYSVSPANNSAITFVAGQKYEKPIFPFSIPINNRVFYDNFFDEAKKHIVEKQLPDKPIYVSNSSDISKLTETIYNQMVSINDSLNELGFETTRYTCAVEIPIYFNNNEKVIDFYILDKSVIHDLLIKAYSE